MRRRLTTALACLLVSLGSAQPGTVRFDVLMRDDRLAPLPASFRATVPAGTQVNWDFGDGSGAQGADASHTFYVPGRYVVTASVTTPDGRAQSRIPVEVRDAGPEQARATLLSDGTTLFFDASASRVYAPLRPSWTLDGRAASSPAVQLTAGWHTLHLSLPGRTGSLSRNLRVYLGAVQTSTPFELEVLRLTNAARAHGWNCDLKVYGGPALPPLARSAQLDLAAHTQTSLMALNGYTAHESPIDDSRPGDRVAATGYVYRRAGENIAGGQQSPQEVVDAWLRSPGHCHNIMGDFQEIGVAYAMRPGTSSVQYWAQVFGSR